PQLVRDRADLGVVVWIGGERLGGFRHLSRLGRPPAANLLAFVRKTPGNQAGAGGGRGLVGVRLREPISQTTPRPIATPGIAERAVPIDVLPTLWPSTRRMIVPTIRAPRTLPTKAPTI